MALADEVYQSQHYKEKEKKKKKRGLITFLILVVLVVLGVLAAGLGVLCARSF